MPLVSKNFSDIITFTRASTGTFFNSAGTLTTAAIDAPRFDYNPSTLAAQGLLIEESRTNSIRNNTMQGAVAGTPGTAPTNYTLTSGGGVTRNIVGVGTENGITYIDVQFSSAGANNFFITPEPATQIAAVSGQTWASSFYVRLIGGTLSNLAIDHNIQENSAAGAFLAATITGFTPTSASLVSQRNTTTRTLNNASTAFVQSYIRGVASGAYDITLRIGLPQLEQGAFATSVIPTTTTALTRSQDRAVVSTLSPWFNATTGTIYAEFAVTQPASGGNQFLARFSDNSYNNQIGDFVNSTGFVGISTASGGVFDGLAATAVVVSANTITKAVGAYATNDLAAVKDGGAVATDPTATIPSGMTRFDLGSDHGGFNNIKAGYLRRISYYPRKLSSAELQAITA